MYIILYKMSYPLFTDLEFIQIEDIIDDCVYNYPDEIKMNGSFIYLCAGCSIY
jgi:hypothetical protein